VVVDFPSHFLVHNAELQVRSRYLHYDVSATFDQSYASVGVTVRSAHCLELDVNF
jgi:hypothetical protein